VEQLKPDRALQMFYPKRILLFLRKNRGGLSQIEISAVGKRAKINCYEAKQQKQHHYHYKHDFLH